MISRGRLESVLVAATPAVVAATILGGAAGYTDVPFLLAHTFVRWLLIGVLFVFAVVRAAVHGRRWHFPAGAIAVLSAFCALSLVSTVWSVDPRGTLERAVAQPTVVAALVLLAGCAATRPVRAISLLDGMLAAAFVVAVACFVYWRINPSNAVIPATTEYGMRYRGLEGSPDTLALLLAIAMPVAFWRLLRAVSVHARVFLALVLLGLAASVVATGSRGGLGAGFFALLVVAALSPLGRARRAALAAVIVVALVVAAWATTQSKALPQAAVPQAAVVGHARDAERVLPLTQEIGNPWWTHTPGNARRSLTNTSVRLRALRGAFSQALGRPILGYGFGAEQWAFINRYYAFSSGNPENGYVSMLLQLGAVGFGLWLVVIAWCVLPALQASLRPAAQHPYALGALGAAAGALAMGLSQSYFHGPGGIAYVALWTSLVLCAAVAVD